MEIFITKHEPERSANMLAPHSSRNSEYLRTLLYSTIPNKIDDERAKTSSNSFCDPDRYIPLRSSPKCTLIPFARERESMKAINPPTTQQAHSTLQELDTNPRKRIQQNYTLLHNSVTSNLSRLHISCGNVQEALFVDLTVKKTNCSTSSWKSGEDEDYDVNVNGIYIPGRISGPSTFVFPPPTGRMTNAPRFATKQRVSKRTYDKRHKEKTLTRTTTSMRNIAEKLLRKRKFRTKTTNAPDNAVDNK